MPKAQQKINQKDQKLARIAHFSGFKFRPKLLTRQQFFHIFGQNNRETHKNCIFFCFGILSFFGISAILATSVSAETKTGVSVEVVNGCSVSITGSDHSAEITPGTYAESIGDPTVFKIACNDTNVYTISAVGYSNGTEGNTNLLGTSDNGNISTGIAQNGGISNWSFHLFDNSDGVTISPTFNQPHEIPGSGTVVAKRESGFKNPGETGYDLFKVAYSIYTTPTQRAGSYSGKVKYTLFNQGISYGYKITYDLNGGDSGPDPQIAESMDTTIKLSNTTPTREGYDFVTWCSKDPDESEECSGDSYNVGAGYTLPGNNADITLYATWKKSGPPSCQNGEGIIMKDGKCWSSSDVSSSSDWSKASTLCSNKGNGWRLPSQADFNSLILAYYPRATYYSQYTGYQYDFSGDAALFTNDWGATSGFWLSSTTNPSDTSYAYLLTLIDSRIFSHNRGVKIAHFQVRCVSSI